VIWLSVTGQLRYDSRVGSIVSEFRFLVIHFQQDIQRLMDRITVALEYRRRQYDKSIKMTKHDQAELESLKSLLNAAHSALMDGLKFLNA
jgi:hypothetical protein